MTELHSLIAATAAKRLGLTPTFAHLDSTSFHVDGRSNSDEPPDAQVIHMTQGYSRDHRPNLNQGMLDLMVEHQAGMPVLMQPLSGHSSDKTDFGQVPRPSGAVAPHLWHDLCVADRALYSAENLQTLAETGTKWITRVPATWTKAQEALALAKPETMRPLTAGYRDDVVPSRYGGVDQR